MSLLQHLLGLGLRLGLRLRLGVGNDFHALADSVDYCCNIVCWVQE